MLGPRDACRTTAMGSTFDSRSAGRSPNRTAVSIAVAPTNAMSRQSIVRFRATDVVEVPSSLTRARADSSATGRESAAPPAATRRPSTSICDTSRARDAPRATRITTSRSRALARASMSVARFPQVMSRTSPVRPRSSESDALCESRSRLTPRPAANTPKRRRRYPSMSPAS